MQQCTQLTSTNIPFDLSLHTPFLLSFLSHLLICQDCNIINIYRVIIFGDHSEKVTPVPFPNTAVKLFTLMVLPSGERVSRRRIQFNTKTCKSKACGSFFFAFYFFFLPLSIAILTQPLVFLSELPPQAQNTTSVSINLL